jgi:hypothetical protein
MPKSKPGKWSVILIIAMPIFFLLGRLSKSVFYLSVSSGETIIEDILRRPVLALLMLGGMGSGIAAFVTGLLAIVREKDRGLLVIISAVLGMLTLFLVVGEIAF